MAGEATATNGTTATNGAAAEAPKTEGFTGAKVTEGPAEIGIADILSGAVKVEGEKGGAPKEAKPEKLAAKLGDEDAESEASNEKPEPEGEKKDERKGRPSSEDEARLTQMIDDVLAKYPELSGPAGMIKAGLDTLKHRHSLLDYYDARIKKKQRKAEALVAEADEKRKRDDAELEPTREAARYVTHQFSVLDPNSGANAVQRLHAIGRLIYGPQATVEQGRQWFEEQSLSIAQDGKAPAPSRTEQELRARLEQMQNYLHQQELAKQQGEETAQVQKLRAGIAEQRAQIGTMAKDAAKYPAIAAEAA